MRSIDLASYSTIELWPNRSLYLQGRSGALIVRLPAGSMSWGGRNTIAFGPGSKTSVVITGPDRQVKAIWDELIRLARAGVKEQRALIV